MFATKRFLLIATLSVLLLGVGAQDATDDNKHNKTTTTPPPTTTTTTTTPKPTTTTTTTVAPPTTPTPKPTPAPKFPGNEGKWSVEDGTNVTCIMLKGALEIQLKIENKTEIVDVPNDKGTVASGNCSLMTMTLKWTVNETKENWIKFAFEKNETTPSTNDGGVTGGKYALMDVTGNVFVVAINKSQDFALLNKAAFQTPLNHSYSCLVQEELKGEGVTLKLSDIRMEAFMVRTPGHREFSAAIDCPADDSGDVVPIAVGAALAGLVVVVLVAYLIGRRRSRARGYQSV